jgi:uncharacterized protein (DUF58 family)
MTAPTPTAQRAQLSSSWRRLAGTGSGVLGFIERRIGITPLGLVVLALGVVGILLGRKISNGTVVLFAYGLIMLLVVSWLVSRRPLPLKATRAQLPTRIRVGQQVEAHVQLETRRPVNTVIVEDELPTALGIPTRHPIPRLSRAHPAEFGYTFAPTLRGVYQVGPLRAEAGDPFGLTRRRHTVAEPVPVIVHPRIEPVTDRVTSRAWEDPPVRPPVSKRWPTGFEFYGMRDYEHGDDPRRIVWRAVAAHDQYLVRESEQGITDRVQLVIDNDGTSHSPGRVSSTFETAVSVVASLAVRHLEDGMSVTIEANAEPVADGLRGTTRKIAMLDDLARLSTVAVPIERGLDRLLLRSTAMQHVVLITPKLSRNAAARLRLMIDRGVSLLLVLILWEDTDPATVHRAGMLGCNVVEVHPGAPLNRVLGRVVGTARR